MTRLSGGRLARFAQYKAAPEATRALAADHPAVVEGRTLFPGRVSSPWDSPRYLVDGANNAKIGGRVSKGPWKGMPTYTLTLEERATCPRSCAVWDGCYGNAMPWPKRHDHRHEDFIAALAAEVITVARQNPEGFVVRLHVLGDFYSVAYVRTWAHLLAMLPMLRVYGYTSRRIEDSDSAEIAAAINETMEAYPDRFRIRTSSPTPGPGRTIVVNRAPTEPDVLLCPAQTGQTAACSTCALCWSPHADRLTIAFLRHGIKISRRRPGEPVAGALEAVERLVSQDAWWTEERMVTAGRLWLAGARARQIADYLGDRCDAIMVESKMLRLGFAPQTHAPGRPPSIEPILAGLGLPRP